MPIPTDIDLQRIEMLILVKKNPKLASGRKH